MTGPGSGPNAGAPGRPAFAGEASGPRRAGQGQLPAGGAGTGPGPADEGLLPAGGTDARRLPADSAGRGPILADSRSSALAGGAGAGPGPHAADGWQRPGEPVQSFLRAAEQASTLAELGAALGHASRALGFDHFELVVRTGLALDRAPVRLHELPEAWAARLARGSDRRLDPVAAASMRATAPFAWSELPAIIRLTPGRRALMAAAAAAGLGDGWTVPFHRRGTATGFCSFITAGGRPLPTPRLPAATRLAAIAVPAAGRIAARADRRAPSPRLTPRQRDCVVLAGRGKSDWAAARILGLSPETVHKYLEAAKARFGVSTRTELVVRALYEGQIGFADLID